MVGIYLDFSSRDTMMCMRI